MMMTPIIPNADRFSLGAAAPPAATAMAAMTALKRANKPGGIQPNCGTDKIQIPDERVGEQTNRL